MANLEEINSDQIFSILNELSESLTLVSPDEFLQILPEKVCELLDVPVCILWEAKQERNEFHILATDGEIDNEYKEIKLDFRHPGVQYFFRKNKVLELAKSLLLLNLRIF